MSRQSLGQGVSVFKNGYHRVIVPNFHSVLPVFLPFLRQQVYAQKNIVFEFMETIYRFYKDQRKSFTKNKENKIKTIDLSQFCVSINSGVKQYKNNADFCYYLLSSFNSIIKINIFLNLS